MEENRIYIKNMVCQRCIMTVSEILKSKEIAFREIGLGFAELEKLPADGKLLELGTQLSEVGFELIEKRNDRLISQIKSLIIAEVYAEDYSGAKLSEILTSRLAYDYSHITHIFTQAEGQSIQTFYNSVKIERIKELLAYDEFSIAQIADRLGFSTPAYLSTFFKKSTGYTPSQFRDLPEKDRKSLDSI
ncbi:AraC family transcriptional regulator protein [Christiangramia flava JLT2011]|uniref:Transcriptional regulator, AraC family n=2 Tax=Flavobacteriaceae TaxID=49546 RepID=A0A1L7I3N0_9FLAO|nr:Transcriptional regulator, AraC family [Christiangramia flava JLT2011]OSS40206.1 AraC family transcriptional regulator protein [Christiangramia flava JLT2011]